LADEIDFDDVISQSAVQSAVRKARKILLIVMRTYFD